VSLEPISLRLQGRGGWLHPGSYLVAVRAFWGMLRNLDMELSQQPRGSVDWEISALKKSGPALVVFIGHLKTPPKDILPDIKRAVLDGVRTLSQGERRPRWYNDSALEKLKLLAEQHATMDEIAIVVDDKEEPLRTTVIERIERLTNSEYETQGSVVGCLESITVNGDVRLRVTSEANGRTVICRFARGEVLDEARHLLGQRVEVHGTMRRNYLDEPVLLEGTGYEAWPEREELPSIASMSGRISKLTGELSVRDYIARLRDDK
jgi:hypothetical protein